MRNRVFKAMCKVPMNLQLFAEGGDGAGAGEGNGSGSGEGTGGEGDNPPSFDDFLKTGSNQAEFDRRVQKAVNTAVTNAQEKWQALTDDKLSEADKLAKMTKEEKAQYMQKKPFAYWNVGGRSFKMKLKASGIGRLENKYRQNLMNMIDDIPPLSVMLTIIQEAMSPWEHGIDYQDVQKLYDAWIDEGNSQLELYQKILISLMVVSGFLPEKTAASLLEEIENA